MRQVQQEVAVVQEEGRPRRFSWGGRTYPVVQVTEQWRFGGRWWVGEPPRDCYLVQAGLLTAELHREDTPQGRWWLARVQD